MEEQFMHQIHDFIVILTTIAYLSTEKGRLLDMAVSQQNNNQTINHINTNSSLPKFMSTSYTLRSQMFVTAIQQNLSELTVAYNMLMRKLNKHNHVPAGLHDKGRQSNHYSRSKLWQNNRRPMIFKTWP